MNAITYISPFIKHISVTQGEVPPLYTAEEVDKLRAPPSAAVVRMAVASLSDAYNSNKRHIQGEWRLQSLPPDQLPDSGADPPTRIRYHHHPRPARFRYDTVRCDTSLHHTACRQEPVDRCSYSSQNQSYRRCSSLFPTLHIAAGAFAAGAEQIGAVSAAATALAVRNMSVPELRRQTVSDDAYWQSLQHGPDASSQTALSRNRQVVPSQQEFPSQLSPQSQSSPASTIPLPHSPGVMVGTSSLLIRQFVRTSPDPMAEQTFPKVQGEKSEWDELE
ncbi:zincin [Aspergillus affinis]|uniref:zincin n=1 Tax=Aspergillus affinis TaxID=1070780 RepID=UPI0022FDDBB2|nr:zincin [Aspergillus affinis]KAI9037566.1 zincin [Aspergillus affinis]